MISPKQRDPRLITIRRGGTLTDADHQLLAVWAAACAEHVLHLFEAAQPSDARPREAIEQIRAWARGEISMSQARAAGGHAGGCGTRSERGRTIRRDTPPARPGWWRCRRARAWRCGLRDQGRARGRPGWRGRERRPARVPLAARAVARREICALVLDDQRLRNAICWSVFDC